MPPRVQEDDFHEFSPAEKMFICNQKMAGEKYPKICELFTAKFGKAPPSRSGLGGWWPNMTALKRKIKIEFGKIPELMVQKSIMNMKKRGALMVGVGVSSLRGGGKLLKSRAVKYVIH